MQAGKMTRHLLSITDLTVAELWQVVQKAVELKANGALSSSLLAGKGLAYLSEKPSTRTRLSLQAAVSQLGGFFAEVGNTHLSKGNEDLRDTALALSQYVSFIAARVYSHQTLAGLATHSSVPVINALSDKEHPCQALADLATILTLKGKNPKIAFIGDGNNVCTSLALAATMLGMKVSVATPKAYGLPAWAISACGKNSGGLEQHTDPKDAVCDADVVYTDSWVSMGEESIAAEKEAAFQGYQISESLMAEAKPDAIFMHCMPAHKGKEVEASVIEGPKSAVAVQAENRLHAQKALLLFLNGQEQGGSQ